MTNEITSLSHSLCTTKLGCVNTLIFSNSLGIATVLILGDPTKVSQPLVRIHSRCLYGEVFGSLDCDCGEQVDLAFQMIKEEGTGIFIYLEQEGRGCGLINKARAYILKEEKGFDTVQAYEELGLEVDPREYRIASSILIHLGIQSLQLLTNNPRKVTALRDYGLDVNRIGLRVKPNPYNYAYLLVKQTKLNHDLGLDNFSPGFVNDQKP